MQTYNDAMMSKSLQQGLKRCQRQLKVVFREYHELSSCRPLSSFMVFETPWISSDYLRFLKRAAGNLQQSFKVVVGLHDMDCNPIVGVPITI